MLPRYYVITLTLYRIKVLSCILHPVIHFITLNRYTLNHSINIIYTYIYIYIIIYTYIFTFRIHHIYTIHLSIEYSINIHSNKGVFLYILTFNVYIWPISYKINEYYNGIIIQNRPRAEGI